ncbi:hypothetical protein N6H18_01725 [Reichenbachiella agarivorans]|uniref:Uncharacterized protein n=1 Tax=Reichenbachiella agarivorans TaxID=2979464 RepID=A0ABY6CTH1_9BACT|nr:hypothetical protein [Reichenbachiella agarivorans]UXP32683.1 hypothetical protein N6H18_01725 [Reichenbachiella agarivorans]
MIKLRQKKFRLSGLTLFSLLSLVMLFLASCDEDNTVEGDPRLFIEGPTGALPETSATYDLQADIGGTTSWTVEGPAQILSSTTSTAEIQFLSVGDVTITATNGGLSGTYSVIVSSVEAAVESSMNFGKAKNGATDTLFLSFSAPLASAPTVVMNGLNAADTSAFFRGDMDSAISPFVSGATLSSAASYKGSNMEYFAIFTGGTGNGQAEAIVKSATLSESYGGGTIENVYLLIQEVDNVAPIGSISFSQSAANDSTVVTITAQFNEAVRAESNFIFIDISYADGSGVAVKDTLWATADAAVWALDYTVNGESDEDPSTNLNVSVSEVVDMAGNVPTVLDDASLIIDNIAPIAAGTATDSNPGTQVVTVMTSGEWLILKSGTEAPATLAEFGAGGSGNSTLVLDAGTYDVYFIEVDAAGNVSDIVTQTGFVVAAP